MAILEEIPLLADEADQTADIVIAGEPYTLRMLWNARFKYWSLSLSDRDDEPLLVNVKVVPNYPLVGRYRRTTFAGDLYFVHRAGKTYAPTFDDVGGSSGYGLFYYDAETPKDYPTPLDSVGFLSTIWDGGATQWDVVDGVGTTVWL